MSFAHDGDPTDVLRLNVGGTVLQVFRRTLTIMEGSKLASKFSGRWDHSLERDDQGNIFIDQDIRIFVPLLNFLRAKVNEAQCPPGRFPKAPLSVRDFDNNATLYRDYLRMLDCFGLYEFLYLVRIRSLSSSSSSYGGGETSSSLWPDVFDPSGVEFYTEAPHYFALEMAQQNNSECVTSFELRGAPNTKEANHHRACQIVVGWMKEDDEKDNDNQRHGDKDNNNGNENNDTIPGEDVPPTNYFPIREWWPGSGNMMKGSRIKSFGVFYALDNFSAEWSVKCSWDRASNMVRVHGSYGTQASMDFSGSGKPVFGGVGHWKLSTVKTAKLEHVGPYV